MRRVAALVAGLALLAVPVGCQQPPKPDGGTATTQPPGSLPGLPPGWPSRVELGLADPPGGAASLRASAPFGFRYQYLAGGVDTGDGWATWNPDGLFARWYVEESHAAGVIPVLSYYQLRQSGPGASMPEVAGVMANLRSASTMGAYYADLRLLFRRVAAAGGTVVLHVEPDLWGYLQQASAGDDPATVPVRVGSTGDPDVAGLPDTAAGFAQAVVRLRDRYAPGVLLAWHLSPWASGVDVFVNDPPDADTEALARRSATFLRRLGARFDLAFLDVADRDAGFDRVVNGEDTWLDDADYARLPRFVGAFVRASGLRVVLWQLPLGNTVMRAVDDTWGHFRDDKVERLLDDPSRALLHALVDRGVVALLFGGGAPGTTCACDATGDGVTDPPPVGTNVRPSLSADDDGGFFRDRAAAYYASGAVPLP